METPKTSPSGFNNEVSGSPFPVSHREIALYYDSDDARKWPSKMAVLTDEYERNDRGVPQWFNINHEDVDGNEMYQSYELKDFEGTLYYALEGINEI